MSRSLGHDLFDARLESAKDEPSTKGDPRAAAAFCLTRLFVAGIHIATAHVRRGKKPPIDGEMVEHAFRLAVQGAPIPEPMVPVFERALDIPADAWAAKVPTVH